jgi:integral membrane sensor domain MASE1
MRVGTIVIAVLFVFITMLGSFLFGYQPNSADTMFILLMVLFVVLGAVLYLFNRREK